jgi:hypothetical protein
VRWLGGVADCVVRAGHPTCWSLSLLPTKELDPAGVVWGGGTHSGGARGVLGSCGRTGWPRDSGILHVGHASNCHFVSS